MPIYWVCALLPRPVVVTFMKILVYLGLDANICPFFVKAWSSDHYLDI